MVGMFVLTNQVETGLLSKVLFSTFMAKAGSAGSFK